jgi:RimJ/RimL family protein N-acetyltransferase
MTRANLVHPFLRQTPGITDIGDQATIATTPRLEIRPWRQDDAGRLFDLLRRTEVVKWLSPNNLMTRPEEAERRIEQWSAELAADPRFGRWAAVERATGIPAGTVLLKRLPDGDGEVEIGWYFHPDSWGRGLASESAQAVLAHGFAIGLQEVWAVTHLDNDRSAAVCRKLGMRLLGVTHRWYHEPSLMFWVGASAEQQPSLPPDQPLG